MMAQQEWGLIVDKFKKRQGTILLGKDIHRICAWGKKADLHSQGYNYLIKIGGLVFIDRCLEFNRLFSSMHQAEKNGLPEEVKKCFAIPAKILETNIQQIILSTMEEPPENGWDKVLLLAELQSGLNQEGENWRGSMYAI